MKLQMSSSCHLQTKMMVKWALDFMKVLLQERELSLLRNEKEQWMQLKHMHLIILIVGLSYDHHTYTGVALWWVINWSAMLNLQSTAYFALHNDAVPFLFVVFAIWLCREESKWTFGVYETSVTWWETVASSLPLQRRQS